MADRPLVLIFAGLDPSGAGLQADIETCSALGCHALPIATALTVQNTLGVAHVEPVAGQLIRAQTESLLRDVGPIAACKIGLLPNYESLLVLTDICARYFDAAPVIVDPIIKASTDVFLSQPDVTKALVRTLLPHATLVKPNTAEAANLTDDSESLAAQMRTLTTGHCRYVLLTGTDASIEHTVNHRLYRDAALFAEFSWPKYPGQFHGTGCTLTSAVACYCARGLSVEAAVGAALCFTFGAVESAYDIGGAQKIPNRRTRASERWP